VAAVAVTVVTGPAINAPAATAAIAMPDIFLFMSELPNSRSRPLPFIQHGKGHQFEWSDWNGNGSRVTRHPEQAHLFE
jgi:hypothetical protein